MHDCGTGLGHFQEDFLFMRGVSLDRFHKIRDQIDAAFELNVDAAPRLVFQVEQTDETVVYRYSPQNHDDENSENDV